MNRFFPLALIAVLASPAVAQVTAAQTDALVAAIAAAGCEVTEANNAAVLAAAALSEDQAAEAVSALLADGRAAIEAGALRLKTAGCN